MKRLLALALLLTGCASTPSIAGECFLLQRAGDSKVHVVNAAECGVRAAPASTFKIPHALIALERGVVTDPHAPVKWDGSEQPFAAWQRDHSLDSAMKSSVLWFFRRTAGLIGAERMKESLRALRYSPDTFEGDHTLFWTNGDLAVSPREQHDFLLRLFSNQLSASRANVDIVKAALLMPPDKITNAAGAHDFVLDRPGAVIRAKTGNTSVNGERVSWLAGAIELRGEQWVFVARKRAKEALPTTAGAEVARKHLRRLLP